MRFGISADFRNPPKWVRPSNELYADILKQIKLAEDLGFHKESSLHFQAKKILHKKSQIIDQKTGEENDV